jgi:hypothetical protein
MQRLAALRYLSAHYMHCNFARFHTTLECTPAMAAETEVIQHPLASFTDDS